MAVVSLVVATDFVAIIREFPYKAGSHLNPGTPTRSRWKERTGDANQALLPASPPRLVCDLIHSEWLVAPALAAF